MKLIYFLIIGCLITSCKKDTEIIQANESNFHSYRIKTITTVYSNYTTVDSFYYNTDNLVEHITYFDTTNRVGMNTKYVYAPGIIYVNPSYSQENYKVENGLSTIHSKDYLAIFDTTHYIYNSLDYITHNLNYINFAGNHTNISNDTLFYDSHNNNFKRIDFLIDPYLPLSYVDTFKVVTNEFDLMHFNTIQNINKGMKFLGMESDNLITHSTITSRSNPLETYDYSYQFDNSGRVIKKVSIHHSGSLVETITERFTYY